MDLMRILTREEPIGGLEITDLHLRLCFLEKTDKKSSPRVVYIEEALSPGTITQGRVTNPAALSTALKKALGKKPGTSYFIVSIPAHGVYTKRLSFPKAVEGERFHEAVRLALELHLPVAREKTYTDYEFVPGATLNEALVVSASKELIDGYVGVLQNIGLRAVAVETHPASLARAVHSEKPVLITLPYADSITLAVIEREYVRFSRTVPRDRFPVEKDIAEEARRVRDFYTTEYAAAPADATLEQLVPPEYAAAPPQGRTPGDWLVALGALARGGIPRAQDTHVSLLPVGTKQAYELQKAMAFASFVRNVSIGIACFFVAAYAGTWGLMLSIQAQSVTQSTVLTATKISSDVAKTQVRAQAFNELVGVGAALAKESPVWSPVLSELLALVPGDITITGLTINKPDAQMQLTGSAKTRAALVAFRDTFAQSASFTGVTLPITNLGSREDIPFTLTFALRAPQSRYPQ